MAPLTKHLADCKELLGNECIEVNKWIDEFFSTLGPKHRKMRHHREGAEEARILFGDIGAKAALIHIIRDCRHIPRQRDYELGFVDVLGLKQFWPTSAYVQFTEEDFRAVVTNEIGGPKGLMLWSFIDESNINGFMRTVTRLSEERISQMMPQWTESRAALSRSQSLEMLPAIQTNTSTEVGAYVNAYLASPLITLTKQAFAKQADQNVQFEFGYVPISHLVTPLVFIDFEYLEQLRAELQGQSDLDIVKFALPSSQNVPMRIAADPTKRSLVFISSLKSVTVSPMQVQQTPLGTEVRFFIGANLSVALVSVLQDRLVLRNGIHRAFLLAQLGHKEVPCILIREGVLPPVLTSAYPAFTAPVVMNRRPPLLVDYLNPELSVEVPLARTNKVVRISAEESILPVD